MICDFVNINDIIKSEHLDVLVVSYGGCCTNTLITYLENNNFKCNTPIWAKILCHCPQYIEIDIPIIYVYDNPIKSLLSMKNRGKGCWDINQQKLSNDINVSLSDENLIKCMINQFNIWTNIKKDNVCLIKSCELFENNIVNKLEYFLKKKIYNFPILYKTPNTNIETIECIELNELFEKYKIDIDRINNFPILYKTPNTNIETISLINMEKHILTHSKY